MKFGYHGPRLNTHSTRCITRGGLRFFCNVKVSIRIFAKRLNCSSIRAMVKVGVNFSSQKLFASVYGCSTRRVMNIIHHLLNKNLMTKVALAFLSDLSKIHGHEIIHLHYSIIFFRAAPTLLDIHSRKFSQYKPSTHRPSHRLPI